ncbi:VWFA domain-containing protein [Planctomycetales bacterium 10988]|nr:VWFA domain-containing protein [Planctomycetales bacterium 10988]
MASDTPQSAASASPRANTLLAPEFLARLEQMELVSRKVLRGRLKGERRSKRRGQSVEFADFRNYVKGDDLRFIDWNLYARLDKLFLKLFLEEEDLHFYTLIDTSRSMDFGEPTKLQYAKQIAAALGFIGLTQSDRVVIETMNQSVTRRSPALRGRASLWRMLDYLQNLEPDGSTDLTTGIKRFCLRHPGPGIVVVISDFMDKNGFEEALRYLVAQRMDAYVIQLLSPEELEPALQGDLKLVDCEDGDIAEITASSALYERYRRTLANFVESLRTFCMKRGMVHLMARTDQPFEQIITQYLRQRGLVR